DLRRRPHVRALHLAAGRALSRRARRSGRAARPPAARSSGRGQAAQDHLAQGRARPRQPLLLLRLSALSDARLRTDLWVRAHLRRLSAEATPVALVRRGEPERGTVLLKLNLLEGGCRILTQVRDLDGRLGWLAALGGKLVPEAEAD